MPTSPADLLRKHRIQGQPAFFVYRDGSIRDQIRAAATLVRTLHDAKIVSSESRILVVGGGVTGVATALTALHLGAESVTIKEIEPVLFSLQARCPTRWFEPYEYAWPLPYYTAAFYPHLDEEKAICPRELRWRGGSGTTIAKTWEAQIWAEAHGNLYLHLGIERLEVNWQTIHQDFNAKNEYNLIFVCVGGVETTHVDTAAAFASYAYWEKDPFENLRLNRKQVRILVSGGGDGVLQDMLRVTCPPKRQLLSASNLKDLGWSALSAIGIAHRVRKGRLFSASALFDSLVPALSSHPYFDQWMKESQSMPNPARPNPVDMLGHHLSLVEAIQDNPTWKGKVGRAIESVLEPDILRGDRTVTVAFRQGHFSKAFALNSLLVHLVARFLHDRFDRPVLRPSTEIDTVMSSTPGHACSGSASACCGPTHQITFKSGESEEFEVIIARHGSIQSFDPPDEALVSVGDPLAFP